ncbi:MAG: methylenetetrahydrofolate reductase [NAD(P)H] [Notoacmeibacter sp.]|nr:methylenetetrahydrofolate reductase [NAD(P)H] [Notoacmeibacter sp.]
MASKKLTRGPRGGTKLSVSFEFFPPKTEKMAERLWETVQRLAPLQPAFVSVTYGAGGSTRERSLAAVKRIISDTDLEVAAHLTCVDATRDDVNEVVDEFAALGVKRFVALRGDPSTGIGTRFRPHPEGYANGAELVGGLRARGDFDITVSAYPEKHPESPDFATDIEMLKRKVDNGATRAITQFFFENDDYERYVERARRAGIYIPIVPGIQPIHQFSQVANFASRCGASIPQWLAERFEGLEEDPQTHQLVAAAVAAEQVLDLMERGVDDFHFYTMNKPDLVYAICHLIGIRAQGASVASSGSAAA